MRRRRGPTQRRSRRRSSGYVLVPKRPLWRMMRQVAALERQRKQNATLARLRGQLAVQRIMSRPIKPPGFLRRY